MSASGPVDQRKIACFASRKSWVQIPAGPYPFGFKTLNCPYVFPEDMPRKGDGKWLVLLNDSDVKRWYDNLARGSRATADNYLRVLGRFLAEAALTPKAFLRQKSKERDDLLADCITSMLEQGRAGSYVDVTKKAVVSWLDWNGEKLRRKIRIPGAGKRPSLRDAHIPSQEELRRVLNVADSRARVAISLIAFGGLRPGTMGTYLGDDGLTLRDFVEARVVAGTFRCKTVPTRIEIPERLSKTGRAYFTFLGAEAIEYVSAYLGERAQGGEKITPESSIITPRKVDKPFMRTINIGDLVRKPMRSAGLKEPPYIWRSYFASRAMLAESRGLSRDYRSFLMGHTGDVEHVYALHKTLPPDTVETIRKGYRAALDYLETTRRKDQESELKILFRSQMLLLAGLTEAEVDKIDLDALSDAELQRKVRDRLLGRRAGDDLGNGTRQKVVPMTAVEQYIEQGWEWVAPLPDDRAVVRLSG